ncbi:MAG: FeoA family protein [Oscillospiraceae bacterium]|nr:FeoA family protein [Oscillospiraceae bacterium]
MMPLTLARTGESAQIQKVGGNPETRRFLENLGFVPGEQVRVVSENNGNLIVSIKDARVAISREMAGRILI